MGKIQDAINQAFGLASPKSDAQRSGGSNFTDKQARKANKWLSKKDPVGKARGDRRGTPVEKPYDFYKRQAKLQAEREEAARKRQERTDDRQGPHGNPTRGKWGGIY